MKNGILYFGCVFLSFIMFACGGHQAEKGNLENQQECFAQDDTTEIVRLATEYLEHLKKKEFDAALQMLYCIHNGSVLTLAESDIKKMRMQYETFPVLNYHIDGYYINGFRDTEIAFSVEFFEKTEGDTRPNTMNFRLNPQKIANVWYLSMLNR